MLDITFLITLLLKARANLKSIARYNLDSFSIVLLLIPVLYSIEELDSDSSDSIECRIITCWPREPERLAEHSGLIERSGLTERSGS